jgi:hypothetical protein
MTLQLDLFTAPSNPRRHAEAQADPLHGISVQLPDICPCGSQDAVIGEGKGPHCASFFCSRCGKHRGWMPNEAHIFVVQITQKFGKPSAPIRIRRNTTGREADDRR